MSIYRTATANSYDNTLLNIQRRQQELATMQDRLSSGKRVLKPSDDAVAATLDERARNREARVTADLRALEASRTALTQAESGLGEANDILHNARELMVQAGNPVLTANERADLALQLEGLREQMLAVANRQDTNGLTLFGGLGGASKPFIDQFNPGAEVLFQGQPGQYAATETALPQAIDGNAAWMSVPQGNGTFIASLDPANPGLLRTDMGTFNGTTVPAALGPGAAGYRIQFTSDTTFQIYDDSAAPTPTLVGLDADPSNTGPFTFQAGQTLAFGGGVQVALDGAPKAGDQARLQPALGDPGDIFQTLQNTIDALRYSGDNQPAHLTQELARGLTELDAGADRILLARGRVGDWLNRADTMDALFQDRKLQYQAEQSRLTDLDMVEGISEFQNRQLGLEAALSSYSQVKKLSLFQYIA